MWPGNNVNMTSDARLITLYKGHRTSINQGLAFESAQAQRATGFNQSTRPNHRAPPYISGSTNGWKTI